VDGSIDRYKARLVAKGYAQQQGIDYTETYAPVAKFTSIRTILTIGAIYDLEIHQMDVRTAFLNGDIEEEIYMTLPEGVEAPPDLPDAVCKLLRSLYGLKQSPRMWNKKIDDFLLSKGYRRLDADHSVYIRRTGNTLAIIAIYVDDLLLVADATTMPTLKRELSERFSMTDCGEIHHFLGLQVQRDRNARKITLDQTHFVDQVLSRFGMVDCKPVSTPLDASTQLKHTAEGEEVKEDENKTTREVYSKNNVDSTLYRQIIGSLMFLTIGTRPDISAAVGIVSQFAENPSQAHFSAAKRILRYLRGTREYKLHLGHDPKGLVDDNPAPDNRNQLNLIGFSDASWGNDLHTRKSTTGYVFYLSGGLISWSSKRQSTVALSSTEAEYMALTHTTKEAVWLRTLTELGFEQVTTTLYEDNQSSIALAKNPVHHARTKHIDIQYHFIREKINSSDVELVYLPTEDMVADALTKPLPRPKFERLVGMMGLYA